MVFGLLLHFFVKFVSINLKFINFYFLKQALILLYFYLLIQVTNFVIITSKHSILIIKVMVII